MNDSNEQGVRVAMIVAMARNRVIGRDNKLPWYLPNDLKYFKRTTLGKPVVMGRLTWESLGRPLPGRTNIVISRDPHYQAEGAKVVADLDQALELAGNVAFIDGQDEVMILGGAQIYALALPRADRLYITEVQADVDGDAWFPRWDRSQWVERGRESFKAEGPNPYDYDFVVFDRC
ncbi:Protein containing dihydrofolate reductase region domain [Alloalcanivorax dieselolei B5]|uniref:Dihydrofolate reductase n=1 Tax=Alcanivorax dieselolei (strain DSM 16502 / CGMCC 1.3690 / MCCC 1A00001 / B-5) TaxID=930169 RepID=K0C5Q1_ALCDB|nr:dihydrofolate reductase [Alloalcanivorax dieselolei]AFT68754.1 Protein containing dihydrofolate reductase region domain [Alloalcanivorax dieselolei B5]GGK04711.1 dihydrofolate reductase [Alloalcanivorax dieselolei]